MQIFGLDIPIGKIQNRKMLGKIDFDLSWEIHLPPSDRIPR
jgi:hypothetical protein